MDKLREAEPTGEGKLSFDLSTAALETGLDIEKSVTALNNLAKAGVVQDYKLIEEMGEGEERRTIAELVADAQQIKSYLKTISYI